MFVGGFGPEFMTNKYRVQQAHISNCIFSVPWHIHIGILHVQVATTNLGFVRSTTQGVSNRGMYDWGPRHNLHGKSKHR